MRDYPEWLAELLGERKTLVVAEIGSNHCGSLDLAKEHIRAASESGADAVKFQSIRLDRLYREIPEDLRHLREKIELPEEWYGELAEFAKEQGVLFLSSPTYTEAVDLLEETGVPLFKIASPQTALFPQIVRKIARTGKPILLSCGQVGLEGVARAVELCLAEGNDRIVLLHTLSLYPTPYEKLNLRWMVTLGEVFGLPYGLSDHSEGIYAPVAAVALSAVAVEKHFILNRDLDTPDAVVSLTPAEFSEMVRGIRAVEKAMEFKPRLSPEREEREFSRRIVYRLVLKRDKCRGEGFSEGDFAYLRHPRGIDARLEGLVVEEFIADTDLKAGELLEWRHLRGKSHA